MQKLNFGQNAKNWQNSKTIGEDLSRGNLKISGFSI